MKNCKFPGCGYEHRNTYGIRLHEQMHSNDPQVRRPHQCQHCEYRVSSKYKLKEHMLLHLERTKYSCSVSGCEYRTHNKQCMKKHDKYVHVTAQVRCASEGCSYTCKLQTTLEKHIEAHHSGGVREKLAKCPMCEKMFFEPRSLRNHLRSHTKEKPWRCSFCSYETNVKTSLNKHLEAIHGELHVSSSRQLLQQCQLCGFSSSFSKIFQRHVASHTEDRPFPCTYPGCKHRAKRRDCLTKHEKSVHCPKRGNRTYNPGETHPPNLNQANLIRTSFIQEHNHPS